MALLPQTVGMMRRHNATKRMFLEQILSGAKASAFRDPASFAFIEQMGLISTAPMIPDVVFGLHETQGHVMAPPQERRHIGIALYCNYSGPDAAERKRRYLDRLQGAVAIWLEQGMKVSFLPMEEKGAQADDRPVARQLIEGLRQQGITGDISIVESRKNDIRDTLNHFPQNDVIIAYKTHSVIFSLTRHIPVVAVAYHQKSLDYMRKAELADYAVMDEDATTEVLVALIAKALANTEAIMAKEKTVAAVLAGSVRDYMDSLFR